MIVCVCCTRAVDSLKCVYVSSCQMEIILRSFNLFCILNLSPILVVLGSAGSTGERPGEGWEYWGVLGALGSTLGSAGRTGECREHWGVRW